MKSKLISSIILGLSMCVFISCGNSVKNDTENVQKRELKIYSFTSTSEKPGIGTKLILTINTNGSSNSNYKFYYTNEAEEKIISDFSSNNQIEWIPEELGEYKVYGMVKDGEEEAISKPIEIEVISQEDKEALINKQKAEEEKSKQKERENIAKQEEEKKKYIGIDNGSIKDVKSGAGDNVIGKRGYAEFDKNSITEQSLINYYNDYIKDKGYNYYTIVNKEDKNKGIVFPSCMSCGSYGDIDNTGGITKSYKEIEITDISILVTDFQ